jgi:hypothetical protein
VTSERLENWYLERNPDNAKFPYALYPTPGLKLFAEVGEGPIRGLHRINDELFVVSGKRLKRVYSTATSEDLGEIKGVGNVHTAGNDQHVLVVTGGQHAYAVNGDGTISIAEDNMVGAAYQDGYGISVKRGTEMFYISDVDDLTGWSGDFSSADVLADPVLSVLSLHRNLVLLGRDSTEWWSNTGAADFPFAKVAGGFAEIGIVAPGSAVKGGNTAFWLGQEGKTGGKNVYVADGFQPKPISSPGISHQISKRNSPQSAWGFTYSQESHTFYVLNFSDKTMVYDLSTGLWHYRKSKGIGRWRANCHEYVWNKNIVGDYENGKLYELDLDTYDEDGETIRREADTAPIHGRGDMAIMHELFFDIEMGVGLDGSVQGSDPELIVSWSDDDGRTWSNEITVKLGKIGGYKSQARLWGLGQYRQRSIRIAISDPVPAHIMGLWANIEATPT